jgi:RecA/RadA recombinase
MPEPETTTTTSAPVKKKAPVLRMRARRDVIDAIVSKVNAGKPKEKSKGMVHVSRSSTEVHSRVRYVLETGLGVFDRVTGRIPFGRVTEIFGTESSGKTSTVIRCAVSAQAKRIYELVPIGGAADRTYETKLVDPDSIDVGIMYIDNEQSLPDDEKIVVEVDGTKHTLDVALGLCDTVDQMFKMAENAIDACIKFGQTHQRQQFIVVIVDTIAATSSKEEMKANWDKDDFNRQPKQLRQGFRRLIRKINHYNVAFIATNQVSANLNAPKRKFKSPIPNELDFSSFGGKALKFYASHRIFMYNLQTEYKLFRGQKFSAGYLVGFTTVKNRIVKPFRHARLVILFEGGLNPLYSVLETLISLKFVTTTDTGVLSFNFAALKIKPTTFGQAAPVVDLDDADDDDPKVARNPKMASKRDWPEFYLAHKVDLDLMTERAYDYMFQDDMALDAVQEADGEGDEDDDGDDSGLDD